MIEAWLDVLAFWLLQADVGIGLLVLVGLSMSLAHFFSLLANRLSPRQIAVQLLLDALVISVALLLCVLIDMLLLAFCADQPVHPSRILNGIGAALIPGLFYGLAAVPYIGDLIALTIWVLIHFNEVALLHAHFALAFGEALLLSSPGYLLALLLVGFLFHQRWQAGYRLLASQLDS